MQNFLSKLSPRGKKIFYITIIIVVVALMDRVFITPSIKKVESIKVEIEKQKLSIAEDQSWLKRKDSISRHRTKYKKYISKTLPEEDVINTKFFSAIEKLAIESNINLIKSNPSDKNDTEDYIEFYANLDCTGKLKDMISFMHLLNSSDDLYKITGFNMSPKRGVEDEVITSMTVVKMIIKPDSS